MNSAPINYKTVGTAIILDFFSILCTGQSLYDEEITFSLNVSVP